MNYEQIWDDLMEAAKADMDYQRGLRELIKKEEAYLAVCDRLSAEQRTAVEEYISACEELGDCMTLLAWRLGSAAGDGKKKVLSDIVLDEPDSDDL